MNKPARFKKAAGFTLIELMIVVGLIAVISGISIPSFNSYIETQNLRQAQDLVVSDLRTLQNRALNGVQFVDVDGQTNYWVFVYDDSEQNRYYFYSTQLDSASPEFSTECTNADTSTMESSMVLPTTTQVMNGTDFCIFFNFSDGTVTAENLSLAAPYDIILGYPDSTGNECVGVTINEEGLVYDNDTASCP